LLDVKPSSLIHLVLSKRLKNESKKSGGIMSHISRALLLVALTGVNLSARASTGFSNLTKSEYEDIVKEVSNNFAHRYISGASSLGSIFGFEVGLLVGQSSASKIKDLSNGQLQSLYHGGLSAALTVPFGVSFEGVYLPNISIDGSEADAYSLGAKWTFSEAFFPLLPVSLALRGGYAGQNLSVKQNLATANGTVSSKTLITTLDFLVSANLGVFEPYIGLGTISTKNDTEFSGTGTVFDTTFTLANKVDTSLSGARWMLGSQVFLGLFTLGAEYHSALDANGFSAKFALRF
jgi:hypothetical protein